MANGKERTIFEKGNIHGDKVFTGRRVKAFIASLMQRVTNKNTCLSPRSQLRWVRAMVMNIGCAPEYPKRKIRDEAGRGI